MARNVNTYEVIVRRTITTRVEVEAHHPREAEQIVELGTDPDSIVGFDVLGEETFIETYHTENLDAA